MMKIGVIVTTKDRPAALARSLPQIQAAAKEVGASVLVIDDDSSYSGETIERRSNSEQTMKVCLSNYPNQILRIPKNVGLAGALNIGLSYFLADPEIEAIAYFQDDVEVDPLCLAAFSDWTTTAKARNWILTGHDAAEHPFMMAAVPGGTAPIRVELVGVKAYAKVSCRATMLFARREAWESVMPIRSKGLGLPSRTIRDVHRPELRGTGSGVDWWLCRDAPKPLAVLCVPGLVRTFAWKKEDSTWDNEQVAGEDPPLSRAAIDGWLEAREKVE